MVIRGTDRVAAVIGRDESLIDVFVSLAPAFERLRNPAMRRVMARLVTVEQAARMAGVDARELVARLNAHVAVPTADDGDAPNASPVPSMQAGTDAGTPLQHAAAAPHADAGLSDMARACGTSAEPPMLARIPVALRSELDVRAELRAGREPFSLIMAARSRVPPGGALAVRAIFEPVPLYAVMRRQGFTHYTEQLGDEDWRVWFFAAAHEDELQPMYAMAAAPAPSAQTDSDVVVLDVRGLEPPEPMMRTLAALEQLPPGGTLVQLNVRVPQFLLPLLEERGFTHEIREQEPDLVRVFIRRRSA